jgi:hypothetical protein
MFTPERSNSDGKVTEITPELFNESGKLNCNRYKVVAPPDWSTGSTMTVSCAKAKDADNRRAWIIVSLNISNPIFMYQYS